MNNTRGQTQEARKQQEETKAGLKQVKVAIDALTNEVKAYRAETKNDSGQKWIKRTATAAIAYTALTAVIMLVGLYQSYLIRSNNVVSERAFVSVGFRPGPISYSPTPKQMSLNNVSSAITQGTADAISVVSLEADLTNSGNTPTKNLTAFIKCAPSVEQVQDPWTLLYQGVANPMKVPQFIGAHASSQMSCGFNGDQIRAIANGTLFGYVMIDIAYQDRLTDDWHRTEATGSLAQIQFIPAIQPGGTIGAGVNMLFVGYGRHNCADEECPRD